MRAVAVTPLKANSGRLIDVPEPRPRPTQVLIRILEVGYCGTDVEISMGLFGSAPPGSDYLILGHECLGEVVETGRSVSGFRKGELVVATVRRPCTTTCRPCRQDESDMCLTGDFTERGIGGLHGFMQEFVAESPRFLVKVPRSLRRFAVLLEPMTIVQKAVVQAERIQQRLPWQPRRVLILGAGPVGMLAALLSRLRGWDTAVAARTPARGNPRSPLLRKVGASYVSVKRTPLDELTRSRGPFDLIIEATGSAQVAFDAMTLLAPNGVLCLTSITGGGRTAEVPIDAINMKLVLGNQVVFGSVNANRSYFEQGVRDMRSVERRWPGVLEALITKRFPLERFREAFTKSGTGIKSVITIA